jgi:hypothetical protein
MESALLYKMTIWTGPTYDETGRRGMLTIEAYFEVALWGSIRQNRNEYLPSIGIPFFQDWVSRRFGMYVPESEINVRFEREQPAETEDDEILVDFRVMTYRGKSVSAQPYPQETIPLDEGGSEYDPDYNDEEEDSDEDEESDSEDDEEDSDDSSGDDEEPGDDEEAEV